ncbi:MAG: hypothetical protein QF898_12900 [SAR202 cluster bacterium]|nr:hypothetical protein [SAR202 cluster bacterium]MDP6514953.1 hypothetical protein [SAR202 cluster bacterium]MDP6714845.1 hypothetical protein [SAR202 cluster bacterium]
MRRLKEIWPDYAEDVPFYAINVDPTASFEEIEAYREQQGYPWPMAQPAEGLLADFKVTRQSTKVAVNSDGFITYRDSYGKGSDETWHQVFQELAAQ